MSKILNESYHELYRIVGMVLNNKLETLDDVSAARLALRQAYYATSTLISSEESRKENRRLSALRKKYMVEGLIDDM